MAFNTNGKGLTLEPRKFDYTPKDVILYNIGIGATDIEYVWENKLRVIPSFAVVPPFTQLAASLGPMSANPMMLLHGEQKIIIKKSPLPVEAKTINTGVISDVFDKGKGALYRLHTVTKTEDGVELFDNYFSLFVRGAGGWGGEKGPEAANVAPNRPPDKVIEYQTLPIQAMIYRLSGDINPLHIDPNFAKVAGFDKPILHGLCSFGFVARAVIEACCGGDPDKLKEYEVRFRNPVFPGQKIIIKIWKEGSTRCVVEANTDDGRLCIANTAATFSA